MLRLLLITWQCPYPPRNGVTVKTCTLLKSLEVHPCIIDLVFFHRHGDPVTVPRSALPAIRGVLVLPCYDGLRRLVALGRAEVRRFPASERYWHTRNIRALRQFMAEEPYDLIFIDGVCLAFLRKAIRFSAPVILSINDSYANTYESKADTEPDSLGRMLSRLKATRYRVLEEKELVLFDAVHVVAASDAHFLHDLCAATNVFTITNGLDCEYYRPSPEPRPFSYDVHAFCNLSDETGRDISTFYNSVMIEVLRELPSARMVVVGRCARSSELRFMKAHRRTIQYLGWMEDVRPSILVSKVGVAFRRGHPRGVLNKVLQYMAMGLPVVGNHEAFNALEGSQEGVHYLCSDTPETMAVHIVSLLKNPELRYRIGTKAREFIVQHLSLEGYGEQFWKAFQCLVQMPARRR